MPHPPQATITEYYSKIQIETASKRKAVCMLHERSLYYLIKAQNFEDKKPYYCTKAQNILSQLQSALKITDQTSQGIFYLYDYCYMSIDHGDVASLKNAIQIISTLSGTFHQLLRKP